MSLELKFKNGLSTKSCCNSLEKVVTSSSNNG